MSFWDSLLKIVTATGNALAGVVEAVRTLFEGDPETRRKVAFSVAMIALSAKMAKADGIVSEAEVAAFRETLERATWADGRETAGDQAATVKTNLQIPPDSAVARELFEKRHDLLVNSAFGIIHQQVIEFGAETAESLVVGRKSGAKIGCGCAACRCFQFFDGGLHLVLLGFLEG